tara:strand:+ start:4519 stop:6675 length:2157 start_codon:yes stop_codon:yes gene_type:complete
MIAELADGRKLEFPDGTDPAVVQRTVKSVLAQGGAQKPAAKPAENFYPRDKSVLDLFETNIHGNLLSGLTTTMRGAANLLPGNIGDKIWPKSQDKSGFETVGAVLDPVAWGIGGVVARALPYAKVLGSGGVNAAKAIAKNLTGGAIAGGTVSGLSSSGDAQQTGEGAAAGAVINALLPSAISAGGKTAAFLTDAVSGNLAKIKAGNVVRQAAGADLPAVRAAYAAAAPGETATQATAGLKRDTLDALGKFTSTADETSFFSRQAAAEKQAMLDAIRKIAGGANQTEAITTASKSKAALNRITTPMRETVGEAADTAGTVGARLQGEADRLSGFAADKVADVRRLEAAGQLAETGANAGGKMSIGQSVPEIYGMPRVPGRYSYGTELAKRADEASQGAADASLLGGKAARFKQMQADSIAASGLKPLEGAPLIRELDAMIANPKIGSETMQEKVLTNVRNRMEQWTKENGTIDFDALYGIRKSAVNDAIETLMGAADPKTKASAAAGILTKIKPSMDAAITKASGGGPEWANYLSTHSAGMKAIDQQKMGAKALGLLETSPAGFEKLVSGNDPKAVRKIFDTEFDIASAMGDKIKPMQVVSDALARNRGIDEGANRGGQALRGIIEQNTPSFKLMNLLDPRIAIINRVLGEGELRVGEAMKKNLIDGMKSGKSAEELINALPLSERNKVVKALVDVQGGMSQYPTRAGIVGASHQGERQ